MPLSMSSSSKPLPEEDDAIRTVHAALDAGVAFIDTADIYAPSWDTMGHNEAIVGKALKAYGGSLDGVVVGTKGGITRSEGEGWGRDGSIEYLRTAVEASLRRLQVDVIDLYQWHRPDRWMLYSDVIANSRRCRTRARSVPSASRTRTSRRSRSPSRCSAKAGWRACRTSSRRATRAATTSCSTRGSTGSHSYRGAPSAAPVEARRTWAAVRRVPGDRRRARRQPTAGGARVGAVARRPRDPDPGREPPGLHHRLGEGCGPRVDAGRGPAMLRAARDRLAVAAVGRLRPFAHGRSHLRSQAALERVGSSGADG